MKKRSVQQFAIVTGDSAQTFTNALNEKLVELQGKDVSIDFYENFLGARIYWTVEPESDEDDDEVDFLKCYQCPFFALQLKADGTPDARAKFGRCVLRNGKANGAMNACGKLYEMLKSGEVELCLAD